MTVAVVRKKSTSPERPTLSPEKGKGAAGPPAARGGPLPDPQPGEPSSAGPEPAASRRRGRACPQLGRRGGGAGLRRGVRILRSDLLPDPVLPAGGRLAPAAAARLAAGRGARLRRGPAARLHPGPPPDRPRPSPLAGRLDLGRWRLRGAARGLPPGAAQLRRHPGGARLGGGRGHGPGGAVDPGRRARRLARPRPPALAGVDPLARAPARAAREGAEPPAGDHQAPPAGRRGEAEEDAACHPRGAPALHGRRLGVGRLAAAGPHRPPPPGRPGDRETGRAGDGDPAGARAERPPVRSHPRRGRGFQQAALAAHIGDAAPRRAGGGSGWRPRGRRCRRRSSRSWPRSRRAPCRR